MGCKINAQSTCPTYPYCIGCNGYFYNYHHPHEATKALEEVSHVAVKAAKAMSVTSATTTEYFKAITRDQTVEIDLDQFANHVKDVTANVLNIPRKILDDTSTYNLEKREGENKMSNNINWKVDSMDYICDGEGVRFKSQLTGRPDGDIFIGTPTAVMRDLEKRVGDKPSHFDGVDVYKYIANDIDMARVMVKQKIDEYANRPRIEKVVFNPPATIVFWQDGTKTVVKAQNNEDFDPEKGLAMAITKKTLGNTGSYYDDIKYWVDRYEEPFAVEVEKAIRNCELAALKSRARDVCDMLESLIEAKNKLKKAEMVEFTEEALIKLKTAINTVYGG